MMVFSPFLLLSLLLPAVVEALVVGLRAFSTAAAAAAAAAVLLSRPYLHSLSFWVPWSCR